MDRLYLSGDQTDLSRMGEYLYTRKPGREGDFKRRIN